MNHRAWVFLYERLIREVRNKEDGQANLSQQYWVGVSVEDWERKTRSLISGVCHIMAWPV